MAGTIHLNSAGEAHMNALIDAGKISDGPWNAPTGGDSNLYLAVDTSEPPTAEAHWKYPFANGGSVNKKALASIESYATTNNQPDVAASAHAALAKINAKSSNMSEGDGGTTLAAREIFSTGTWSGSKKVTADEKFLDQIVASYAGLNSKVPGYSIPIKLGHNKRVGEPAYGYATNVRREGKTLLADFEGVPSEIVDAISKKRYNAVSVELWPMIEYEGQVFEQVLGGVALLGAEWPAVKGLKPLYASEFAEDGALTLSKEEEDMPNTFTQEQHDAAVLVIKTEMAAKVTTLENERDTALAALAAFQDEAEKAEVSAVIEAAEKAGKIVPANKAAITAFAETIRKGVTKTEDRKNAMTQFKAFVDGLPAKVSFTESGKSKSENDAGTSAQDVVMSEVKKLQTAAGGPKKLSYKDALAQVFEADPDLKTRYAEETR